VVVQWTGSSGVETADCSTPVEWTGSSGVKTVDCSTPVQWTGSSGVETADCSTPVQWTGSSGVETADCSTPVQWTGSSEDLVAKGVLCTWDDMSLRRLLDPVFEPIQLDYCDICYVWTV